MKIKITRALLLKPDNTKEVIRPGIIVEDIEKYREELKKLTGAIKVLLDSEETE